MRVSLPSPADFLDSTTSSSGPASSTFLVSLQGADGTRRKETERDDRSGFSSKGPRLSVASHCGASVSFVDLAASSIFFVSSPKAATDTHEERRSDKLLVERTVGPRGTASGTGTGKELVFGWMWMVLFSSLCASSLLVPFSVSLTDDQWHFSAGGGTETVGRKPDDRSEPLDLR